MLVPTPTTTVRIVASKFRCARVGPTQPAVKLGAAELGSGHLSRCHARCSTARDQKRAWASRTGTRVPLNSHSPLTLPGTRSTAGHWLQSSMMDC